MADKFPFRSVSSDAVSVIWVDFEVMMDMDASGFIEVEGVVYRRARDLEEDKALPALSPVERKVELERISDNLGFIDECLPEMKQHLKQSGLKGIEFKSDPDVPGFTQVHASSQAAMTRYMRSRQYHDKNSLNGSGAIIGAYDLEQSRELVTRKYEHHSQEA